MIQEGIIRQTCFICGYRTLENRCDWDICPICFWEDDVFVSQHDESSPANKMSVSVAQANFIRLGAISQEVLPHVRKPCLEDQRDLAWKPLQKTLELLGCEVNITDTFTA